MSSSNKMKGLLKNIRLMFENEKDAEIQIGLPTDVKHVAHIGWDGPSVNSPSWMNEFKSPNGFATAPIGPPGDVGENNEPIQWSSEDNKARGNRNREQATRRNMSAGSESASREKTRTRRSSKSKSSKDKDDPPERDRPRRQKEEQQNNLPDIPKTRRKKSKDTSRSSRSNTKSQDTAPSESGSVRSQDSRNNKSNRDSLEQLQQPLS